MKTSFNFSGQIESDLGLNVPYIKGTNIPIANCRHYCTDGNSLDVMFYDEQDFIDGMNRIYSVFMKYNVVILAFVLMDTHVHFVLYGDERETGGFVHEYLRRTSIRIARRHGCNKILKNIPVTCQLIDNDYYLKTAICYVIKNPTVAGLQVTPYDYPWSSGSLYFRKRNCWTSPMWGEGLFGSEILNMSLRRARKEFRMRFPKKTEVASSGGMIFPGEYVAFEMVGRIFRTCRIFNYFMGMSREEDLNPLSVTASRLSIPIAEMRQLRRELGMELFGKSSLRTMSTSQRLKLARTLRSRYNCSAKQAARVCGLVYGEVMDVI